MHYHIVLLIITATIAAFLFFMVKTFKLNQIIEIFCTIIFAHIMLALIAYRIPDPYILIRQKILQYYIHHIILQSFVSLLLYKLITVLHLQKNKAFLIFFVFNFLLLFCFIIDLVFDLKIFLVPSDNTYLFSKYYFLIFVPAYLSVQIIFIILSILWHRRIKNCPPKVLHYASIGTWCMITFGTFDFFYYFILRSKINIMIMKETPISIIGLLIAVICSILLLLDYLKFLINSNNINENFETISSCDNDKNEILTFDESYQNPISKIDHINQQLNQYKIHISQVFRKKPDLILYLCIIFIILRLIAEIYHLKYTTIFLQIIFFILLIAYYFIEQQFSPFLSQKTIFRNKTIRSSNLCRNYDFDLLKTKIENMMKNDKCFCDEELNLRKFSQKLNMTSHQLSEFLNTLYNKNFNTFVNSYRIEEAKSLLLNNNEMNAINISLLSGFNSYTSFYNAFKKIVGMPPAEYRKRSNKK